MGLGLALMIISIADLMIGWAAFFSDKIVAGRAVGTLGIVIAGLVVLGEADQFTTQLVAYRNMRGCWHGIVSVYSGNHFQYSRRKRLNMINLPHSMSLC
jgi:hypothetical protein